MKPRYGSKIKSINSDFKCISCNNLVLATEAVAGVKNRNHCPYCLSSKHVDHQQAGDRLSACRGHMRPVGLTIKKTNNKYGGQASGELMLVHECLQCGKISINRIAADDLNSCILEVFSGSFSADPAWVRRLEQDGVRLLRESDQGQVYARLFGRGRLSSAGMRDRSPRAAKVRN
jgi:DNA-directed RNA polymerase subunit RPC12/RpoP